MNEREMTALVEEHQRCNDEFEEAWKADDSQAMEAALELMNETRKRGQAELKREKDKGATIIMHGLRLDGLAARVAMIARQVERFESGRDKDLIGLDQRIYRLERKLAESNK